MLGNVPYRIGSLELTVDLSRVFYTKSINTMQQ